MTLDSFLDDVRLRPWQLALLGFLDERR